MLSQIPLFTSTIVLMLNMWGSGSTANKHNMKEMEDIYKGMEILKSVETRWHTAGRLWDMLYELAIVGELPLPAHDLGPGYHTLLQPHFIQDRRGSASRASDSAITSRSVSRGQPRRGSVPHSTNIDWFGGRFARWERQTSGAKRRAGEDTSPPDFRYGSHVVLGRI